jgi:hypothetical protein
MRGEYALHRRRVRVDNGRRLAERAVHWRHACHVRVRGDDDRRSMRLELTRRHIVLRLGLGLMVGVPLLLHMHLLGIAVRWAIVLGVVVGRVWVMVMVDGRVCLGRRSVVLVGIHLLPALVEGSTGRNMAWHHGRQASVLPRCRAQVSTTKRPTCEATGEGAKAGSCRLRRVDGRDS